MWADAPPRGEAVTLPESDARSEWRDNWPVVLAAGLGAAYSSTHVQSLGVMMPSLEREFGWSRAQISAGLSVGAVVAVTCAPVMGMAIDRFGPRRVVLLGLFLYSLALSGLAMATPSFAVWLALWLLLSVAHLHIKPTAWVTAVTGQFTKSRGLALGVLLSISGLGAIVTPVATLYFVGQLGWRLSFVALPLAWGVFVLPLVYSLFWSAKDHPRKRLGSPVDGRGANFGVMLREGFTSPIFVKLALATFLLSSSAMAVIVNIVPILMSFGRPIETAATVAALIGVMQVVGRLLCGLLMDRMRASLVVAGTALLPGAACLLLLLLPHSLQAIIIAVALLGLATGAENDGIAYLAARYFGMRNFGALFGTLAGLVTVGLGTGPILASYGFDMTRSYQGVLWAVIPIAVLVSALFLSMGPYPKFETGAAERASERG